MRRIAVLLALLSASACRGPSPPDLPQTFDRSNLAFRRGELPEARAAAEEGIALADRRQNSEWAWRFKVLRGDILISQRNLTEPAQLAGAPVPPGPAFDWVRAKQVFLKARLELAGQHLPEALALATAADQMASGHPDLQFDAEALAGQILFQTSRWTEAEALLTRTAQSASKAGDRYHEAFAIHQLGMGQLVRSRFDQALQYFERVLTFSDLSSTSIYAKALNNAGICYSRLGAFDRAVAVQKRAIELHSHRPGSTDYEQALGQLGNTYLLQDDADNGLRYVRSAFDAAREANLLADARLWAGNLASAYVVAHQWDAAEQYNEEAKRLRAKTRSGNPVYQSLNSADIALGRQQLEVASRLYEDVLADENSPPAVVWDAHAGLANVAMARHDLPGATTHFEAALHVIEQTRADLLKTDYKLSYLTQLISFYQRYVSALLQQGQRERALEIADSSRGQVLAERQGVRAPARVNLAQLRSLARTKGVVFLSYWLTPSMSQVWVVSSEGIRCLDLPPAAQIAKLVAAHQATIAAAMSDPLSARGGAGDQLYRLLVAPALSGLAATSRVIIIPDGALHAVNFETLPVDGPKRHYLIEDVELQIAPSLASLTTKPAGVADRSLLLVGNAPARPPEFPTLHYAEAEMRNVETHFKAVTTLDADRASPVAYAAAHPERFGFIHFTAHASASAESPLDSAVILAGPDNAYKLYARDVAALPLAAQLVTISACRSAGEKAYSGEGLIGFSWAFLRAGARRVIAGLWDVDDRSTAGLMGLMYSALADGVPPARALRQAKLTMIAGGGSAARPYNWGPFELFTVEVN